MFALIVTETSIGRCLLLLTLSTINKTANGSSSQSKIIKLHSSHLENDAFELLPFGLVLASAGRCLIVFYFP